MKKAIYKKIDERVEYITVHHEETIDEFGNVIPAYDETIEKIIPIMGVVYEEMTQEEIELLPKDDIPCEPTVDERLYSLETQVLQNSVDTAYLTLLMEEGVC